MTAPRPRPGRLATVIGIGLTLVLGTTRTTAQAAGPARIVWRADLGAARAEGLARDRLVWVQFTGPWCPSCRRLEQETLTHPGVLALAGSDFIPVKLRSDEHADLAVSYGLTVLPATVILRPSGVVVSRVEGYLGPDSYLGFLHSSLSRDGRRASGLVEAKPAAAGRGPEMEGYCPVTLVDDRRLRAGRRDFALEHEGRVYLFASVAARSRFQADPERYTPSQGSRCPVARVDRGERRAGSPRWGALYQGHLYLCAAESNRQQFLARPERYACDGTAERTSCHHCWALDALLAHDRTVEASSRGGRALLSHDPTRILADATQAGSVRR
jgi:YHS domain-containing protein/thiol-disulfide isomerase/thioredoxin